jgi:hypothetical protein
VSKVDGETYYRTTNRIFVLRLADDGVGKYPCWAFVQWIEQVTRTPKGRGSEGWHEDFELESRRHEAGQAGEEAIYTETKESQEQNCVASKRI